MFRTVDSASASISASTCSFDVFINHRGSDVKNTLASHIYRRLQSNGLRVFLDQPELERGESFPPQIAEAIATASAHVAIFSPGYANSTWCLRELVDMLKWKKSGAATIIPVFYGVDPSDLRWTGKGKYGEDLRHLEEKRRCDQKTIEEWKAALAEVSNISGFTLEGCNRGSTRDISSVSHLLRALCFIMIPTFDGEQNGCQENDKVYGFVGATFEGLNDGIKLQKWACM